ncbi:response regulator [Mariprofundus ferrooxydans]|uniref:Response regulator FixJ n=1 Tax=Mariprofundus ferrooxydans PV-1 TaxID=314345 RepID=Q0F1L6_9PROT|nr:response regulator [Mariprofundus ferrooxydans]EAU55175.1 response regulator FixJ [Mariprofundus ferrooxydans PV-1]
MANNMFHLIHDDKSLRDLLETIISDAGYDVRCFDFAEHYLQFLKDPEFAQPIAVLSEVNLPGMSGYDLAIEIRRTYPLLKIAIITGKSDDEYHIFAASQLCYSLTEQFQPEKLISLLSSLAACENAHISEGRSKYFQRCDFGMDHDCPFYNAKRLNGKP